MLLEHEQALELSRAFVTAEVLRICGIAGIVLQEGQVSRADLEAMAASLRHRGPDADGAWVSPDNHTGFAHTRLAILDPSDASRQPMGNESGDVQLVYNGEVYNFVELRDQLEKLGHRPSHRVEVHEVFNAKSFLGKFPDRDRRTRHRERRDDRVNTRAILEPRVDQRLLLIDTPPDRRNDPTNHIDDLFIGRKLRVRQDHPFVLALDKDPIP